MFRPVTVGGAVARPAAVPPLRAGRDTRSAPSSGSSDERLLSSASGHAATAQTCASLNHFVSLESPRCVSHRSAPSTYTALPVTLVASLKKWLPRRSCISVCLARVSTGELYAIGHLSRARVWEYNVPPWRAIARHVVQRVGLSSTRDYVHANRAGGFRSLRPRARATRSRVPTRAGSLSPRRINP